MLPWASTYTLPASSPVSSAPALPPEPLWSTGPATIVLSTSAQDSTTTSPLAVMSPDRPPMAATFA